VLVLFMFLACAETKTCLKHVQFFFVKTAP
jgi:hypothetical protein